MAEAARLTGAADTRTGATMDRVVSLAKENGVHDEVQRAVAMAAELQLRTKAWRYSFTINSPANWRKTLLYIAPLESAAKVGYSTENYAEAFGVAEAEVAAAMGPNWVVVPRAGLNDWIDKARSFTEKCQARVAAGGLAT